MMLKSINFSKRSIFIFALFMVVASVKMSGQQKLSKLSASNEMIVILASQFKVEDPTVVKPAVSRWTKGVFTQLGFSQVSLSNWADGGYSSVALNTYINFYANYTYEKMFWENRVQVAYGFVESFGDRYRKSDDKLIIDSKVGYKAVEKVFMSAFFNFRSQFSPGFNYPSGKPIQLVSVFMAPGYISLGVGMDYKPIPQLSVNFSPLASNLVVVENPSLRVKYGNRIDQPVKLELGAQLKVDYKHQVMKNVNVNSTMILFSDFLGTVSNIKVNWESMIDAKVNKFISANIRTTLIYDDEILIANKEGEIAPRVQFKEIFSLGFAYTFGNFKK